MNKDISQYETADFGDRDGAPRANPMAARVQTLKRSPTDPQQEPRSGKYYTVAQSNQQSQGLDTSWQHFARLASGPSNGRPDTNGGYSSAHEQSWQLKDQLGQHFGPNGSASDSSPARKSSNPSAAQSEKNTLAGYLNPLHSSTDQEGPGASASNEPTRRTLTQEASCPSDRQSTRQTGIVDDGSFQHQLRRASSSRTQTGWQKSINKRSQLSHQHAQAASQESTRREEDGLDAEADCDQVDQPAAFLMGKQFEDQPGNEANLEVVGHHQEPPLQPPGGHSLGYQASQEQAHFQKLIQQEMELKMQIQRMNEERHGRSTSHSAAFDASHPSHPYHAASQEIEANQQARTPPATAPNGALRQEMILVDSYREPSNSIGFANHVIVEDSQEDAYTGHTGYTPGTHKSSQMCSPDAAARAGLKNAAEFNADFNPLLSEVRSDILHTEGRLGKSANSKRSGQNARASINDQRRFETILEEAALGQQRGVAEASLRSPNAQSPSHYLTDAQLLGTEGAALVGGRPGFPDAQRQPADIVATASTPDRALRAHKVMVTHHGLEQTQNKGAKEEDEEFGMGSIHTQPGERLDPGGARDQQHASAATFAHGQAFANEQYELSQSSRPGRQAQDLNDQYLGQTPQAIARAAQMEPLYSRQELLKKSSIGKGQTVTQAKRLNNDRGYNIAISDNCRDSLETNTYNTRFTQNTPDLVTSSNDGPARRIQQQVQMLDHGSVGNAGVATSIAESGQLPMQQAASASPAPAATDMRTPQPLLQSNSPSTNNLQFTGRQTEARSAMGSFKATSSNTQELNLPLDHSRPVALREAEPKERTADLATLRQAPGDHETTMAPKEANEALLALRSRSLVSSATGRDRESKELTIRFDRDSDASAGAAGHQSGVPQDGQWEQRQLQSATGSRDAFSKPSSRPQPVPGGPIEQIRPEHAGAGYIDAGPRRTPQQEAGPREAWTGNQSPLAVDSKASEQACFSAFQMSSHNEYLAPLQIRDASKKDSGVTTAVDGQSLSATRKTSQKDHSNVKLEERNRELEKRLNDLEAQLRWSNQHQGAGVPQAREASDDDAKHRVPAATQANVAHIQERPLVEEGGTSPTQPSLARAAHLVYSPVQQPGHLTEQSQSMLIDGLTTQQLHDRLGLSQVTQQSKLSDAFANKLLKNSEGARGARNIAEAGVTNALPSQAYLEDAKNFTLAEFQMTGGERAGKAEEGPSHKYTFRYNENELYSQASVEPLKAFDDQRAESGQPDRPEHRTNIFEYSQQAKTASAFAMLGSSSAQLKDPERTAKNITQASQIRHFVESILSDDQGKRQKSIEASRIGERANHAAVHELDGKQERSAEDVRASSFDASSKRRSRPEDLVGAGTGQGEASRNLLTHSKSSEGGVGASTRVQKKASVLELYQVEKVEDKANEVLNKSRKISRERQLQKQRHDQEHEVAQQIEVRDYSKDEYHQRQPESPLFQTTPQRDMNAPIPALASVHVLSKINSKYIQSMPASTDRDREAEAGENVQQVLMAYHEQDEHQEVKNNEEQAYEARNSATVVSQTNQEGQGRDVMRLGNANQGHDPAASPMGPQLTQRNARGNKQYFQSVLGNTRANTLVHLHHNSTNALPPTIFVNHQSSDEPLVEKSTETEVPARPRSLTRGNSSLLPRASNHPPETAQPSQGSSHGQECEPKKQSIVDPAAESKADTYEYHSIVSQNNQLQVKLDLLQAHCQKMEDERNKLVELNDLKVQEMESKLKLVEIQAVRTSQKQAQQVEDERQHWRKREEEFRKEVRTLLTSQGLNLPSDQLEEKDQELLEKDKKIEEMRHEMEGLHTFYKEQISMIEKNYGDSSFNNVTRLENLQTQSQDFSQRGKQTKGGAAVGEILLEDHLTAQGTPERRAGTAQGEHSESLEAVNQLVGQALMPGPSGDRQAKAQFQKRKVELATGTSNLSLSPTQSHGISNHGQSNGQMIHITNRSSQENLVESRLPHIESTKLQETQTFGGQHTSAEGQTRAGISHLLGSALNVSAHDQMQRLDPHTQNLISSLQQHNAQLTDLLATHSRQQQAAPSSSLSYGEKHRLLEHIAHLEAIHQEVSTSLHKITVENQVLRKLRYAHLQDPIASDHLSKLLPQCLEDEVFLSWCRFVQILNRCIQKCFTRRPGAPKLPSNALNNTNALPVCSIDQDLLIQYIEKMVQSMQNIEKLAKKAPASLSVLGHVESNKIKAQHLKVIEVITESSLKLSQMPALQHQYVPPGNPQLEEHVERGVQDVVNTIFFWRSTVQLHLDCIVQQYRNHHAHEYNQAQRSFEKEQYPKDEEEEWTKAEDEDDFWSDFSDGDYRADVEQRKDENDVLYNLQMWINSNTMEIDFLALFGQMAQRESDEGGSEGNQHSYLIGCQQFLMVLTSSGYDFCEGSLKQRTDLMSLVRAISCSQKQSILSMPKQSCPANGASKNRQSLFSKTEPGYINYKQFLEDIKERPFKWWQNTLNGFLLEIQNESMDFADEIAQDATPIKKSTKLKDVHQGSFFLPECDQLQGYLPKPGTQFEKFCQKIVMNRLAESKSVLQPIFESGKTHLTKASLRKFILKSQQQRDLDKFNLNRLDCHVLVKMLYQINKDACRAEKDPARRQKLKNEIEKISVSQLDHLVKAATQAERDERYRQRCQQLELGTTANSDSKALALSLPSALEVLFSKNEFSHGKY